LPLHRLQSNCAPTLRHKVRALKRGVKYLFDIGAELGHKGGSGAERARPDTKPMTIDQLETTPPIIASECQQNYVGTLETSEGEIHFVRIRHATGTYLVAGGACNAGLLPQYAREIDGGIDDSLQDMVEDIEELEGGGNPSGELLAWHGSLVL
jgi:hypothetical protein